MQLYLNEKHTPQSVAIGFENEYIRMNPNKSMVTLRAQHFLKYNFSDPTKFEEFKIEKYCEGMYLESELSQYAPTFRGFC
jgi:hypothetical protein